MTCYSMFILKKNSRTKSIKQSLQNVLKRGGPVAYPTENELAYNFTKMNFAEARKLAC